MWSQPVIDYFIDFQCNVNAANFASFYRTWLFNLPHKLNIDRCQVFYPSDLVAQSTDICSGGRWFRCQLSLSLCGPISWTRTFSEMVIGKYGTTNYPLTDSLTDLPRGLMIIKGRKLLATENRLTDSLVNAVVIVVLFSIDWIGPVEQNSNAVERGKWKA